MNKPILVKVWAFIGEGGVYTAKEETRTWRRKWLYNGNAGVMRAILPQILEFLVIKNKQARKMLEYFGYIDNNQIVGYREPPRPEYYEKLDQIYVEMRKLNRKGKGAGIY